MDSSNTARLTASSSIPARKNLTGHLRDSVMKLIMQRLSYPAIARRKGWQGIVTLKLNIEADGL